MTKKDKILLALYAKVGCLPEPEDQPSHSQEIAKVVGLPLEKVLTLSKGCAEEGWISISPLNEPPLLYLTVTGVARARRMAA